MDRAVGGIIKLTHWLGAETSSGGGIPKENLFIFIAGRQLFAVGTKSQAGDMLGMGFRSVEMLSHLGQIKWLLRRDIPKDDFFTRRVRCEHLPIRSKG